VNAELKLESPRYGEAELCVRMLIEIFSNDSMIYVIFEGGRIMATILRDPPIKFRFVGTPGYLLLESEV
jgi:hypothetical protein